MKWIKRLLKAILYFILFLLAAGALWWFAAMIRGDDELDPNFEAFFHLDITGYETDNGAIALRGLEAPATEPNSYAWALAQAQAKLPKQSFLQLHEKIGNVGLKERLAIMQGISSVNWTGAEPLADSASLLRFKGSTKTISGCIVAGWFNSQNTQPPTCNEADVTALAADNAIMLERYKKALKHRTYTEPTAVALYGQSAIAMQELYLAQLIKLAQKDRVQALDDWLENMEFYNTAVAGKINLIQLSILMVNRNLAQRALPAILGNDDTLAQAYFPHIQQALRPIFARDVQFEYEPKLFLQLTAPVFAALDNYNLNKFYRLEKAMQDAWKAPPNEAPTKWQAINDAHPHGKWFYLSDWHSPITSIVTNLVLGGVLVGQELTKAVDYSAARSNLLLLYNHMLANHIAPEAAMAFIAQSPDEMRNPLSGEPFLYDPQRKLLYFNRTIEGYPDVQEGILLN